MNYNNQSFIPENTQIYSYLISAPHDFKYQDGLMSSCNHLSSTINDFQRYNTQCQKYLTTNEHLAIQNSTVCATSKYLTWHPTTSNWNSADYSCEMSSRLNDCKDKEYLSSIQSSSDYIYNNCQPQKNILSNYWMCESQQIQTQIQSIDPSVFSPLSTGHTETKLTESFFNDPILNHNQVMRANVGIEDCKNEGQMRQSNMLKSKINAKFLKNYQCRIEERRNERGGITTYYICKYEGCNKEFTRTWSIIDHVRMHEGVRPYVCKFCSRSYTQKGNMIKHMRRHTEPSVDSRRSYFCEFCGHGYTEKYNLKVVLYACSNYYN